MSSFQVISDAVREVSDGIQKAMSSSSKITSTNSGNYDQIFALSQGYLNKSFQQLWQNTAEAAGLHKLKQHNLLGAIDAEIGPPEIVVDIQPAGSYVVFNINILSGKFTLNDVDTGGSVAGMPDGGFDMAGSKIAFKVDITAEKLDIKDPAHKPVLDLLHEDLSDYSLSRLYMDLTTADLTTFNGNESKLPDTIVKSNSNWMMFFSTWMAKVHNAQPPVNTLGYSMTALSNSVKPVTIAPTFLPIFNQFQTYEFRPQPDAQPVQGIPGGDNNCLLYLQMTDGDGVPSDLNYGYTGNLTDAGESGTLLISRKLFWDKWLLPQMRVLNYKSWYFASGTRCSNNEISPNWGWWPRIGADAAQNQGKQESDSFYDFTPIPKEGIDFQGNHIPYGFRFTPGNTHSEDHGGGPGAELKAQLDCETQNVLTYIPGTNKIRFNTHIHSYVQRWTRITGSGSADINCSWGFELDMSQITSTSEKTPALVPGGLAINLVNVAEINFNDDRSGSSWGPNSAPDGAADDIRHAITGIGFQDIAKSIEAGLSGLGHFILPGNGTFAMTDPVFNTNGDFLCQLKYLPSEVGKKA